MIPTLTLCSLDRFCGMADAYNYIIRVVNILTFIYLWIQRFSEHAAWFQTVAQLALALGLII